MQLNQDQQDAAQGIFQFLFSPDKEYRLSGPGGTGKTFLMQHIMHELLPLYQQSCKLTGLTAIPYEIALTATTNRAAEVLQEVTGYEARTIHSFLNLRVRDDYTTGETVITRGKDWKVHTNMLIFIDEASMVDSKLMRYLHEGTDNTCKIIYVGDHCQLAPVFETVSPVYRNTTTGFSELKQPMRNAGQPALMAICKQLRQTVETGIFYDMAEVPGVIDYLDDTQAQAYIDGTFAQEITDSRILAYTNKKVQDYNHYIRDLRTYPDKFTKGEELINNTGMEIGSVMFRPEEPFLVVSHPGDNETLALPYDGSIEFYRIDICRKTKPGNTFSVRIPTDHNHLKALMKFYASKKDWETYYTLKNGFPDLRQKDASTVYKAQGSTYRSVLIDLGDIGTCRQPEQVARMLYVAVSRPTDRIYFYGQLPAKYRGGPPPT